jgi:phage terminase large subunit
MATVQIKLPPKLVPVFAGEAMYRGAYGGRGSAKTRSFAKMAAVWGIRLAQENKPGVIVCGREFMNSLDDSSMAEVKAAIYSEPWLASLYDVGEKYIRTKDRRIEFAFIGLRHNLDSIKSKALIRLLWVDEAEPVSESAWMKAIPTVREDGSEIWITWNPERKNSATHKRFRLDPPTDSKIVELNWRDNPWFPETLNKTRLDDLAKRPDQYAHVWEGDFVTVVEGAYFAKSLSEAKIRNRIGNVSPDPLMTIRAFWDIGGTGAKADACAIWIAQFVGREIRVLDYYEAVGQPLATHVQWLRDNGWGKAYCFLPHDGATNDKVFDVSYESALRAAQFDVRVIPNQGKGAAKMRIEAARRLFPSIWFNAATTEAGRDALGWYHEKKSDDERNVGLGPEHDWSSHGADAFGLMCVAYETPEDHDEDDEDDRSADRGRSSVTGY